MRIFENLARRSGKGARFALGAVMLIGSAGFAAAKTRMPREANQYYGMYQNPSDSFGSSRADRLSFDHSGTRGREGLGHNPFHPEGPGNVVD